ncbi:Phosphopantothenoylcysteine decarboxylase / Phosphopantothenoylcysteine synthetase [hydrothermal vent metagenome]|uniref:Phosphopantothenoylcysteine decarboxylase / Phosphopantothenoylcysteine synthetase n=1 Tax=hydrothermal vent metagenome TaxID=652676 RepID=A0A3B0XYS2_9ZZZZ
MNSGLLQNKNILLGVCGGIAAYKSAELVRRLQDAGADVRVVMTAGAMEFITPLTFQALSGHTVHTDLLDSQAEAAMGHIELARWADLILIAPATANSIARLASGRADDLLCAVCLASRSKMALAPAMNHVMWSADATQQNIKKLRNNGAEIFGPASGTQACGEIGEGRLLEVDELVKACSQLFKPGLLPGERILITAGPTFEAIDPVRFIGNRSSGRMGFALAEAAIELGAQVTLISGPVHLPTPAHVQRIDVESAAQMHDAVMQHIDEQRIFIGCAAVADYRPLEAQAEKIKKSADEFNLQLTPNIDILKTVATLPNAPFTLGFAAETQNLQSHALQKLKQKNLQMIAANLVGNKTKDTGFNSEYNALQVFWNDGDATFERCTKDQLARQLMTLLAKRYYENIAN